jgi:hypothetical protein
VLLRIKKREGMCQILIFLGILSHTFLIRLMQGLRVLWKRFLQKNRWCNIKKELEKAWVCKIFRPSKGYYIEILNILRRMGQVFEES